MSTVKKLLSVVAAAAAAAVLGVGLMASVRTVAAAASEAGVTQAQAAGLARPPERGAGGRGGMCGEAGLAAAAEALDLTAEELQAQLWGGQTLSGLAEKAGVEITDVQAAVQAACAEAQKTAIEQAVTDGSLTRDKADWLLEGLEKGYWGQGRGGIGFGFGGPELGGRGFGGHGRGGWLGEAPSAPATPATPSSSGG